MITYKQLTEGITKPVPMGVVVKAMGPIRSKITDKLLTPTNIAKIIEGALGKKYGLIVSFKFASGVPENEMNSNATYNQDAELEGNPAIEIELLFSPKNKKGITIDNEKFDDLASHIASRVVHEMLHKTQARVRGYVEPRPFKVTNISDPGIAAAQKELGDSDEIEAYGHNIAVELLRSYGSRKNALTALRNFIRIPPDKSPDMRAYIVAFAADKNHPVLKKLVKKVILFLKELEK